MIDTRQYCDGCDDPLVEDEEWHYEGGDIRCDTCVEMSRDVWAERSIS